MPIRSQIIGAGLGVSLLRAGSSGLPASGPYRYYRFVGMPTNDVWFDMAEFRISSTPGGANLANTGNTTVSINDPSKGNLYDSSDTTVWFAALGADWTTPGYVEVDLGSPTQLAEVAITAGPNFWRCVRVWSLLGSADAITWVPILLKSFAPWTVQGQVRTTSIPTNALINTREEALAWRVTMTTNNGDAEYSLSEVIFAASGGGANVATGGHAFMGRHFGGGGVVPFWGPEKCFDSDFTSAHLTNSFPYFVGYVWSTAPTIAEVRMAPRSFNLLEAPNTGAVQWSQDLQTWTDAATFSGLTGWANSTYKTVTVP